MTTLHILLTVLKPVAWLTTLVVTGYAIFRWKLARRQLHTLLSKAVLYVTLPALLLAKLTQATHLLETHTDWYWLPLSAAAIYGTGAALGLVLSRVVPDAGRHKALFAVMCGFHNAGYLPLVIVREVFPEYPNLDVLVMIYVLGASPLLWSISPMVLSHGKTGRISLWKVLNPPILAVLAGFVAMMCRVGPWLESVQLGRLSLGYTTC